MSTIKGSISSGSDLSGRLGRGSYSLPTATKLRLGGIKVGEGLIIESDGTLNANQNVYSRLSLAHTGGVVNKQAESPDDTISLTINPALKVTDNNGTITLDVNFGSPLDENKTMTGNAIKAYVDYNINNVTNMHNNFIKGASLTSGMDLNSVFSPGWYYSLGTSTYTNCPVRSRNFVLCVFPSADGSSTGARVGQIFMTTGAVSTASSSHPSEIYIRGVRRTVNPSNGAFSYAHTGWTRLATNNDVTQLTNTLNATKQEMFTQTKGGTAKFDNGNLTCTLDIGFKPKTFEFIGIGGCSGIYLQWDKISGWTGTAGPLYNYDVDLSNNTVTISLYTRMEGEFIWRAFG